MVLNKQIFKYKKARINSRQLKILMRQMIFFVEIMFFIKKGINI